MALIFFCIFIALGVVGRVYLHFLATGDLGVRPAMVTSFRDAHMASWLLILAFILMGCLVSLEVLGVVQAQIQNNHFFTDIGAVVSIIGIAVTVHAQFQLGESWRYGVDENEKTELVTDGIYAHVRNPIYSGVFLFCLGILLLLPHILMLVSVLLVYLSIEIMVRFVEEPYLRATHGEVYIAYERQTGRYWFK